MQRLGGACTESGRGIYPVFCGGLAAAVLPALRGGAVWPSRVRWLAARCGRLACAGAAEGCLGLPTGPSTPHWLLMRRAWHERRVYVAHRSQQRRSPAVAGAAADWLPPHSSPCSFIRRTAPPGTRTATCRAECCSRVNAWRLMSQCSSPQALAGAPGCPYLSHSANALEPAAARGNRAVCCHALSRERSTQQRTSAFVTTRTAPRQFPLSCSQMVSRCAETRSHGLAARGSLGRYARSVT